MALTYKLDGSVLHVTQTTHDAIQTKTEHWYYDICNWMVSSYGKEGDVPDRKMTDDAITWVKTHYFPKVGLSDLPE